MISTLDEKIDLINLHELEFTFAVNKIDPGFGRIVATQVSWPRRGEKQSTQIQMVDCNEISSDAD